jgi:ligand-binding sensor domain-containing protein
MHRNHRFLGLIITIILNLLPSQPATAQGTYTDNTPIGTWRVHTPYKNAIDIDAHNDQIFVASRDGIFTYNPTNDNALSTYTKQNGLADAGIACIKYNTATQTLIIGYENGNLDFFKNDAFFNLNAIKVDNTTGAKGINNITNNGQFAYLATDFGIVEINVTKQEVRNTFIIGNNATTLKVHQIALSPTHIAAATQQGIYTALRTSPNLANFAEWQKDPNLPTTEATNLVFFKNNFYAAYNDIIYKKNNDTQVWQVFDNGNTEKVNNLNVSNGFLLATTDYRVKRFDENALVFQTEYNADYLHQQAIYGAANDWIWSADRLRGLVKTTAFNTTEEISPQGPYSALVYNLSNNNKELLVASGSLQASTLNNLFVQDGIFSYKDGSWTYINKKNTPNLNAIYDYTVAKRSPTNGKIYAGTWGAGLIELDNNNQITKIYDKTNSSLRGQVGNENSIKISDINFDPQGNIYVSNYAAPNALTIIDKTGTSQAYPTRTENEIKLFVLDDTKQKWLVMRSSQLAVMNATNTQTLNLNGSIGKLSTNRVRCIAQDLEGAIWIGTDGGKDGGINVFYNPANIFKQGSANAQRIKVQVIEDNKYGYLMQYENVNCIAIDGANRKWIGTENGVWLISADGVDAIKNFTTDNSPLPSNNIISIAINNQNGEVFIATEQGLVSYRSDAIAGTEKHQNVKVFPNPVRPEYDGQIAVSGLVNNAYIKITDITGNLVYQTRADGGQANWNGKDYNGKRMQTGIYLIMSTDELGVETLVTKLLFVN